MELNRSRNPSDHIGYLTLWSYDAHKKKRFPLWEREEILSEAYIQALRLLSKVYDPDKSTVVTFLKAFLWGAVYYTYWTTQGYRFTESGPRLKLEVTTDILCEALPYHPVDSDIDMPELTEEEWAILRFRCDGYTMTRIATVIGLKSPQSVYNRLVRIRDKFIQADKSDASRNRTISPSRRPREKCKTLPGIRGSHRPDPVDPFL